MWSAGFAIPNFPGVYTKAENPGIRNFIILFAPAPVFPGRNVGKPFEVQGFGTGSRGK